MLYKKINIELIVVADEAEAVVTELNAALDRLEERHALFGGGIETVAIEHHATQTRPRTGRPSPMLVMYRLTDLCFATGYASGAHTRSAPGGNRPRLSRAAVERGPGACGR